MNFRDWRSQRRWTVSRIPGESFDVDFQSSLLVLDAAAERAEPVIRRSAFHDTMHERNGATEMSRRYGVTGPRLRSYAADPPDPIFVVRRVGRQARVESFDGKPYSGLMSVEDAIRALREAHDTKGG